MLNSSQSNTNENLLPESCPRCRETGAVKRLLYVYHSRAEAFCTCESKDCTYFVTDVQGDPVKFRFSGESKRLVPLSTPAKTENVGTTEFEELIQSLRASNKETSPNPDTNSPPGGITDSVSSLPTQNGAENVNSASIDYEFDFDSFLNDLAPG